MKLPKILVLTLLLTSSCVSKGQTNLDSLYAVWQDETRSDSIRVDAYKAYIWDGFIFSKPDSAYRLAEGLMDFGRENDYPIAEAHGFSIQGISWSVRGDNTGALKCHLENLRILRQLGEQRGVAASLNRIGTIYQEQGDESTALEYFSESLKVLRQLDDQREEVLDTLSEVENTEAYVKNTIGDYVLMKHEKFWKVRIVKEDRKVIAHTRYGQKIKGKLTVHNSDSIGLDNHGVAIDEIDKLLVRRGIRSPYLWMGVTCAIIGSAMLRLSKSEPNIGIYWTPSSVLFIPMAVLDAKRYNLKKAWQMEVVLK